MRCCYATRSYHCARAAEKPGKGEKTPACHKKRQGLIQALAFWLNFHRKLLVLTGWGALLGLCLFVHFAHRDRGQFLVGCVFFV